MGSIGPAEILVVSDEPSCAYATFQNPFLHHTLRQTQLALAKIGAPHDSILVDDLSLADMGRYKLVYFYTLDEWEFYDLEKDPREMQSQYDNPEYAEEVAKLKRELARLRCAKQGDGDE